MFLRLPLSSLCQCLKARAILLTSLTFYVRDDEMAAEASFKQLVNADELWGRVIPRIYSTAERGHVAP